MSLLPQLRLHKYIPEYKTLKIEPFALFLTDKATPLQITHRHTAGKQSVWPRCVCGASVLYTSQTFGGNCQGLASLGHESHLERSRNATIYSYK